MSLSFGFELRLEQKQVMSQRMIQSMEILQLSAQQLEERIDQELEENPILELDVDGESEADDDPLKEASDHQTDEPEETEPMPLVEHEPELSFGDSDNNSTEEFQLADEFAQNYSDTIDELPARSQNWLESEDERRADALANFSSPSETLQDYLTAQLGWFDLSAPLRDMAERIINNLDPGGYFPFEIEAFLRSEKMEDDQKGLRNVAPEEIALAEEALSLIHRLDPPGIGARDLKECLILQLRPNMPHVDVLRILIQSHLKDISANRLPQIARSTGFALETIQEAVEDLRHLNPRPGSEFTGQASATIIPDVFVDKNEDGQYVVRLEEGRSQYLHVNRYYQDMLKNRQTEKTTRDYIRQKIGSAQWLIDAINQRRSTLLRVSQAIVDYQVDFFEIGPQAIKPLKMQQIADTVGVHITTISRACDEKWMMTPQGIFPLKRFFSGALPTSDGEDVVAQDAVRLKMREIIDKEDKSDPLSDDAIVRLLDEAGIKVARRTVVKYRQTMNIPSSRGRKKWMS